MWFVVDLAGWMMVMGWIFLISRPSIDRWWRKTQLEHLRSFLLLLQLQWPNAGEFTTPRTGLRLMTVDEQGLLLSMSWSLPVVFIIRGVFVVYWMPGQLVPLGWHHHHVPHSYHRWHKGISLAVFWTSGFGFGFGFGLDLDDRRPTPNPPSQQSNTSILRSRSGIGIRL